MTKKNARKRKKKNHSTTHLILSGFLIAIFVGTVLLMLPLSSVNGNWTNPVDALFTATTSVCVTGLVVYDTVSYWSTFGHIVILCLIQCGGLGIVAFTTMLTIILGRRVTLKDRLLLEDAFNLTTLSGLVRFLKKIFIGTLIVEGIGAFFYMFVFVPEYGLRGVWISVFTAVSAFCNAGIDLIGSSSLMPYVSDPLINFVTMGLIISGGIGFIVWFDILEVIGNVIKGNIKINNFFNRLKLHTKITLLMTFILIVAGMVLVFSLEYNNLQTLGSLSLPEKILASLFQSVTTRTAGFATVSQAELKDSTAFVCMILMFIGGSSVGTAGGVKTGTVAVLLITAFCVVRGTDDTNVFGRRISLNIIKKAMAVFSVSIIVTFFAVLLLCQATGLGFIDAAYETVSAVATVGLTRNVTPGLNLLGKIIIILCMYLGRIGPISLAIAFTRKGKEVSKFTYPEEEITVG